MLSAVTAVAALLFGMQTKAQATMTDPGPGCLQFNSGGKEVVCPLKNTSVNADISGFAARVTVRQTFSNPSGTPIEAVYTFPLPNDSTVDLMRIKVGDRVIDGQIKPREEARRIYEEAKNQGKTAAILDQERPNIFTQSVANILPGKTIDVEISYIQILKFENGTYEFNYPMVVGPRFTDGRTPDPQKVTPPITPKGTRTGAGIDLSVHIDAGMRIEQIQSVLHEINLEKRSESVADVRLAKKNEIPNRDFILRYQVAGKQVKSAFLAYADPKLGGFFTLILMPPKAPSQDQIVPKEVVFVMDQSGSQSGFPIQKSKELTTKLIDTLNAGDTFNVISFGNTCNFLWPSPRRVTAENILAAKAFVSGLDANGGTQLLDAVHGALMPVDDPLRRRFIVFNTDGYIGNEYEVLNEIKKNGRNSRIFSFGIGNSVNRFLIDSMSQEGRGDAEFVTLAEDADKAVERFLNRTKNPVLVDVNVNFQGVEVADVLPKRIPDVFGDHPIIVKGRYTQPGNASVTVSGLAGGNEPWKNVIQLNLPDLPGGAFNLEDNLQASTDPDSGVDATLSDTSPIRRGSSIAKLWAREMVDEVARTDFIAMQQGGSKSKAAQQITRLGLAFGIMTQYTSFVAVENRIVNIDGKPRTIRVPVEMADGVSYEGIFGDSTRDARLRSAPSGFSTGTTFAGVRGGGGFGGGGGGTGGASGSAKSNAQTSAPVLRKPNWASNSPAEKEENLLGMALDTKTFDKLPNSEIEGYSIIVGTKEEAQIIKGLTPVQKVRYLNLTRVSKELRASDKVKFEVQINLKMLAPGLKAKLEAAGLKIALLDPALKIAIGTCSKESLQKLAQIDSVLLVKSL